MYSVGDTLGKVNVACQVLLLTQPHWRGLERLAGICK